MYHLVGRHRRSRRPGFRIVLELVLEGLFFVQILLVCFLFLLGLFDRLPFGTI